MAVFLHYSELTIEVFDDTTSTHSANSSTLYDKVIQVEKDRQYSPNSQHAIKVRNGERVIKTGIILASGGGTGVDEESALIDQGNLIIRCCNKLFSLSLPELDINWVIEPDQATCFSVHQYKDTYITHGELSVARVDRSGKELWRYGGADIFVCLDEGNPFEMRESHIALTDFNGSKYRIDYDGNSLDYIESDYLLQEPITILMESKKPWWKFW